MPLGTFLRQSEIFHGNIELRAEASHLILGETLIVRIVGQWGESARGVAPQVVDPRGAPRATNVNTNAAEGEAIAARVLDEFSQRWHLGE